MKKEKACGCIIINDENKILLVYENNHNFWGFPKGHVEGNETEIETALREVKEEVGLDVKIDKSKRFELHYTIRDEIDKTSVFYVAKTLTTDVKIQIEEIIDYRWCTVEETLDTLTYDNWKEMFKSVIPKL